MSSYVGACHCGGVRFRIDTDQPLGPFFRCDCSLCSRKGAVMGAAPRRALSVTQGAGLLSRYQWNTHEAQHFFCKVCGIYTHHAMRGETETVGVNMACIEGFDLAALGEVEMGNGKRWSLVDAAPSLLRMLATGPTAYRGPGVNHENERFVGDMKLQVLEDGRAVLLQYTARLATGVVVHAESTLLGTGPDGTPCLWPVMSELPGVVAHRQVLLEAGPEVGVRAVFGSGAPADDTVFREEITVQMGPDGGLVYAHAWGLPGGSFEQRSSCRMQAGTD